MFRSSRKGNVISNSKPCLKCINDMYSIPRRLGYKIKNIYYSYDNTTIIKTNINKLIRETVESKLPIYVSKYYKTYRNQLHNYLCKDIREKLGDKLLEHDTPENNHSHCNCGCHAEDDSCEEDSDDEAA